jgi:outer membrane protein assembly factor BamB
MESAMKKHLLILFTLSFSLMSKDKGDTWQQHPGDYKRAITELSANVNGQFRGGDFKIFGSRQWFRFNDEAVEAADRLLSLYRMGKISANSQIIRRAYIYKFFWCFDNRARQHDVLELYQNIATPNAADPHWKVIQARSARALSLSETPELYEKVAEAMKGVPPNEEVRKLWDDQRAHFDLPDHIKNEWARQLKHFAKGDFESEVRPLEMPGTAPIKGSHFPLIDIDGTIGSEAEKWRAALAAKPETKGYELDELMGEALKFNHLQWLNSSGFLNTQKALTEHLLTKPAGELKQLRQVQDYKYKQVLKKQGLKLEGLALLKRYPWSISAQQEMLKMARRHLFKGEFNAAYLSFQDVLHHAEDKGLLEEARVGYWICLSKISDQQTLEAAFKEVKPESTWPWNGKRVKSESILKSLTREPVSVKAPQLSELKFKKVQLPPVELDITSVDLQEKEGKLLRSGRSIMAAYNEKFSEPGWLINKRVIGKLKGAEYHQPLIVSDHIITSWGHESFGDDHLVSISLEDKSFLQSSMGKTESARSKITFTGNKTIADNKIFTSQMHRSVSQMGRREKGKFIGNLSIGCFDQKTLKGLWSGVYNFQAVVAHTTTGEMLGEMPVVDKGFVYLLSNSGQLICADIRDGSLVWSHFFRSATGNNYKRPPSRFCTGSKPLIIGDHVICMGKFTGHIFAVDKNTGRRVWTVPRLRAYEMLGEHKGDVIFSAWNALYSIDSQTGRLNWARPISKRSAEGFQLPRAQLIGSSIYAGDKNKLARFNAKNGEILEERLWSMGDEVPMTFHVGAESLYALSDLPSKSQVWTARLLDHLKQTRAKPNLTGKNGHEIYWIDGLILCMKNNQFLWKRFTTIGAEYGSRMKDQGSSFQRSGKASVEQDFNTGQVLNMYTPGFRSKVEVARKDKK